MSRMQSDKMFRIWMMFENGHGSLDYLINKLGMRKKILDNPLKCDGSIKEKEKNIKNFDKSDFQSQSDNGKNLTGCRKF